MRLALLASLPVVERRQSVCARPLDESGFVHQLSRQGLGEGGKDSYSLAQLPDSSLRHAGSFRQEPALPRRHWAENGLASPSAYPPKTFHLLATRRWEESSRS